MADPSTQLGKAVMFRGLEQDQLRRILRISSVEKFNRDAVIFKEGNPGEELYLIVQGRVRITRQYPLGGDETLAELEAGQTFGEIAVIGDDIVRSATARAGEACLLLVLKKEPFRQLLQNDRDLAYIVLWNVLKQVSSRLLATNDKVMMFLAPPDFSA